MPELAEVEFNRKQWDAGLGCVVRRAHLRGQARVFRGGDAQALRARLTGARYLGSESRGKHLLFRFSGGGWLGLHLGMTGRLWTAPPGHLPGKHDHLVFVQARQALVFTDPRQFGRVRFHTGPRCPDYWLRLAPPVTHCTFTRRAVAAFLARHARLPIKAALLLQDGFAGIGNWMADEILWRASIHPHTPAGGLSLDEQGRIWRWTRWVARRALASIGEDDSDVPRTWLFHQRWSGQGVCPRHGQLLRRALVGGRTTAWCAACQPATP